MKKDKTETPRRLLPYLVAAAVVLAAIIYLKTSVGGPLPPAPGGEGSDSLPVAVPDTSAPAGYPAAPPETVSVSRPDTLLRDSRPPYEAGYEDGYLNGMDDGAEHREKATYDETSHFRSEGERAAYREGYREGYAQGFDDGANKRQFNIRPPRK